MTEKEAAEELGALLNKIEEAGHVVGWDIQYGGEGLGVGDGFFVAWPPSDGEPWEVRGL